MADKRQALLEYLKTLLATITTGNGYNFTVNTIARGIRNVRDMEDDKLPPRKKENAGAVDSIKP